MIVRFVGSNIWRLLLKDDGQSITKGATDILIFKVPMKKVTAVSRGHGSNHASIH